MQQSLRQKKAAKGATSEVVEIQDEEEKEVEKALDEAIAKKKEEAQESSDDLTSASEESNSEKTVSAELQGGENKGDSAGGESSESQSSPELEASEKYVEEKVMKAAFGSSLPAPLIWLRVLPTLELKGQKELLDGLPPGVCFAHRKAPAVYRLFIQKKKRKTEVNP